MRTAVAVVIGVVLGAAWLGTSPPAYAATGDSLKPFLDQLRFDRYLDTDHPAQDVRRQFIVYGGDEKRAKQVLDVALRCRAKAQRFFSTSILWKQPAVLLIYPDEESYLKTWMLFGTGGVQIQCRYKGRKIKLVISYEDEDLLTSTLPHELMHLLITDMSNRQYFEGRRGDLVPTPVWIQEGLAEYMTANAERREDFEKFLFWSLHEKKQISLEKLLTKMKYDEQVLLHYAESYSFIAFIAATVPNGRQRLRNYIMSYNERDLAKDPLKAFDLTFQGVAPSVEVLEQRWHAWVGKHYGRHFSPVVVRTHPPNNFEEAALDGRIWVRFDKPIDPATVSHTTMALRKGNSTKLGDDGQNLLRRASFLFDPTGCVLLIKVPGGMEARCTYTLTLSDHVADKAKHGLAVDKFEEMRKDDWWTRKEVEPGSGGKQTRGRAKKKPPKRVTSIVFTTKTKGRDDAGAAQ